ncbi:hypothetical protein GCM10027287_34410 [Bordetella muralis]
MAFSNIYIPTKQTRIDFEYAGAQGLNTIGAIKWFHVTSQVNIDLTSLVKEKYYVSIELK